MSEERKLTPEQQKALLVATLFTALPPEQQAAIRKRNPKQLGMVAGLLSQILPEDQLRDLSSEQDKTAQETPQIITPQGSKRFAPFRKLVSRIPLIRRLL